MNLIVDLKNKMKVIDYNNSEQNLHKFNLNIDGHKYVLNEYTDIVQEKTIKSELLNEWGREIKDRKLIEVAQAIVEKYFNKTS